MAPAPLPLLAGVFVATIAAAWLISESFSDDWLRVFLFLASLGLGAVVMNKAGRAEAQRNPHPLWFDQRLPADKTPLRIGLVAATLLAVIAMAIITARPDSFGSPFPYFVAAAFIYQVIPQVVAREIRQKYDKSRKVAQ